MRNHHPPILLACILLLAACQTALPGPTGTAAPDGSTPTALVSHTPVPPTPTITPSPTPTLPPNLAVDPADLRGLEVNFWHPWEGNLAARAEEAVKAFNKQNEWGLVVRVRSLYGAAALGEAVEQGLVAADKDQPGPDLALPDLVAAGPERLAGWQAAEKLADLNDYIASKAYGLTAAQVSDFEPLFWDQNLSASGQRAGIPAVRGARVLFYNQTWAGELGFTQAPATPAEFQAQACAAAQANGRSQYLDYRGTGGWLISTDPLTTLSWMAAFGAQPVPEKEGQPYRFDSKEADQSIKFLRDLLEKGCAWQGRSLEPHAYFASRMALFYAGSLQDLDLQAHAQETANSGDRWTLIPFPAEKGKPLVYSNGYSYAVFNSQPARQLGAWLFLRYLIEPRNQALLAEVWPSLPVSEAALSELADYKQNFPWFMVLPLRDALRPAPALSSWTRVHAVVEDAAWQVYRLPSDQMQYILPQMDDLAQEVTLP